MTEEKLDKNSGEEIFTIPEEFYGTEKQVTVPVNSSAPVRASQSSSPSSVLPRMPKKTGAKFSSPKFIITIVSVVSVLVVGGFSYYYINQAQVARQKLIDAQKPVVPPVVESATLQPVTPVVSIPEVVTEATSTVPTLPQPVSFTVFPFKNYTNSVDTDNDKLTNLEEALYGVLADKPDTDEDGFLDGLETVNLYNPMGLKPVKLVESGKVATYLNPTFNYSIFYPSVWVAQALDANNEQVIFSSDTGEFIEVIMEDNTLKLPIIDWYLGQSPGVNAEALKTIITKDGLKGVLSPDGLAAYFPVDDRIFVIYYNIGLKSEVNFLTTFNMMINSFKTNVTAPVVSENVIVASSTTSTNQ